MIRSYNLKIERIIDRLAPESFHTIIAKLPYAKTPDKTCKVKAKLINGKAYIPCGEVTYVAEANEYTIEEVPACI